MHGRKRRYAPRFLGLGYTKALDGADSAQHFLYTILCDEVLRNAGVEVLFHTLLAGITEGVNGLKKLTLCGKTGLFTVKTRVIIDCTGDANAVQIAGYAVEKYDSPQPSTYICRLDDYDLASIDMQALKKAYETDGDFVMLTRICMELSMNQAYINPNVSGHYTNQGLEIIGRETGKALATVK